MAIECATGSRCVCFVLFCCFLWVLLMCFGGGCFCNIFAVVFLFFCLLLLSFDRFCFVVLFQFFCKDQKEMEIHNHDNKSTCTG